MTTTHRFRTTTLLALALMATLGGRREAKAGYIVNVIQSGGDVVATGSGTINTTALTFNGTGSFDGFAEFRGAQGQALFGTTGSLRAELFGAITGPSSFGTGTEHTANSGTGDFVGIFTSGAPPQLVVPLNYISNSQLSSSDVWTGSTFNSLGLTTGTYVWTWGNGADADSFTMNIGPSAVPEPASLVMLGMGAVGVIGYMRIKRRTATGSVIGIRTIDMG